VSDLPTKSPIELQIRDDGSVRATIGGISHHGPLETIVQEGPVRDWFDELGLPKDLDQLDRLAKSNRFSGRMIKIIVVDESRTNFPGAWRFKPTEIQFLPGGYLLMLSHLGLVIGQCDLLTLHPPGVIPEAEGACITAVARLYDSALATAAWNGIERKIFTHVSGTFARPPLDPPGGGVLIDGLNLTDYSGCPGAQILKSWLGPVPDIGPA